MKMHDMATGLEPFMDDEGETFINVTTNGGAQFEEVALRSDYGRKVVAALLCLVFLKGYATDRELRVALDVIEGVAIGNPRRKANVNADREIARKPLAKAVVAIARRGGTKKDLSRLLAELNRVALRENLDTGRGPWPTSEDALGKQLSGLVDVLLTKGITLIRHPNDRPRTWSISPLFEESGGSDVQVTDTSPVTTSENSNSDTFSLDSPTVGGLTDDDIMTRINGAKL